MFSPFFFFLISVNKRLPFVRPSGSRHATTRRPLASFSNQRIVHTRNHRRTTLETHKFECPSIIIISPLRATTLPIVKFVVVDLLFFRRHWSIRIAVYELGRGACYFYLMFSFSLKKQNNKNGKRVEGMWATGWWEEHEGSPGISLDCHHVSRILCSSSLSCKSIVHNKKVEKRKSFDIDPKTLTPRLPSAATKFDSGEIFRREKKIRDFLIT